MHRRTLAHFLTTAVLTGLVTTGLALPAQAAPPDPSTTTLLVKYREASSEAARSSAERASKARRVGQINRLGVTVLHVPDGTGPDAMRRLRGSGQIDYVEANGVVAGEEEVTDTLWPQQWGPALIRLPEAWERPQDAGVVVAVLDTGVDAGHEDLAGRLLPGHDFINGDSDPADDHGHGTKVAGVLAATANNSVGVAGGCWSCSILPVKVLNSSNSGTWAALASGIVWATDHGARVISMSLSGATPSAAVQDAVTYAHDRGVLLVAAAGNQGVSTPRYPAAYPEVLSVGGTTDTDERYSWSNYGDTVDIGAPGCNMAPQRGGGYGSFCGTSSAAPLAAGVAAMTLSTSPTVTTAEISTALTASAVVSPTTLMGGRIDAAAALALLNPTAPVEPEPAPAPAPAPGEADPAPVEPEPAPVEEALAPITTEPQPTPTVEVGPLAPVTDTFSGSLTRKLKRAVFPVSTDNGPSQLQLTLGESRSKGTLSIVDGNGRVVATGSGTKSVQVVADLPAGTYQVVVEGSNTAFTVAFTHQPVRT